MCNSVSFQIIFRINRTVLFTVQKQKIVLKKSRNLVRPGDVLLSMTHGPEKIQTNESHGPEETRASNGPLGPNNIQMRTMDQRKLEQVMGCFDPTTSK
jgi:hypothetical protein